MSTFPLTRNPIELQPNKFYTKSLTTPPTFVPPFVPDILTVLPDDHRLCQGNTWSGSFHPQLIGILKSIKQKLKNLYKAENKSKPSRALYLFYI